MEILVKVIDEGKAQGVIRPDVNSELAAWEFWASAGPRTSPT